MEYYEYICIENIIIMKSKELEVLMNAFKLVSSDDKEVMNKCGLILYYTIMGLSFIADIVLVYSIYAMNV